MRGAVTALILLFDFKLPSHRSGELKGSQNMNNSDLPRSLQKWAETRQKGKWRFVCITGVLAWGLPMFVVMTFFVNRRTEVPLTPGRIAVSAILWIIGGFFFGLSTWALSERKYRKYISKLSAVRDNEV